MSSEKLVPIGVKVISIVYYLLGTIGIILCLLLFVLAGYLGFNAESILYPEEIDNAGFMILGLVVGGIIYLGLGILGFFIGEGLWKLKNWARIVAIIIACFVVVIAVIPTIIITIISVTEKDTKLFGFTLVTIFTVLVNLVIAGYLLLSSSVKEAFAQQGICIKARRLQKRKS